MSATLSSRPVTHKSDTRTAPCPSPMLIQARIIRRRNHSHHAARQQKAQHGASTSLVLLQEFKPKGLQHFPRFVMKQNTSSFSDLHLLVFSSPDTTHLSLPTPICEASFILLGVPKWILKRSMSNNLSQCLDLPCKPLMLGPRETLLRKSIMSANLPGTVPCRNREVISEA